MNAIDTILAIVAAFIALIFFSKKASAPIQTSPPPQVTPPTPIVAPTPESTPEPIPEPTPIQKPYNIAFGIPIPTNNFCRDGVNLKIPGAVILNHNNFPYQILPSGGASCVLSESEMFAILVVWQPQPEEVDTTTHIYFYRCSPRKQIYHLEGKDFAEEPFGYTYAAFIGRYDWELNQIGRYHCIVETKFGKDVIIFEVI